MVKRKGRKVLFSKGKRKTISGVYKKGRLYVQKGTLTPKARKGRKTLKFRKRTFYKLR